MASCLRGAMTPVHGKQWATSFEMKSLPRVVLVNEEGIIAAIDEEVNDKDIVTLLEEVMGE